MASHSPNPASVARRTRCVVWHARGRPPAELVAALRRPDLHVVYALDEFAAIAELVRGAGARRQAANLAAAQSCGRRVEVEIPVLLVIDPLSTPGLGMMLRAAERYAPTAVLWVWEPTRHALRAVTGEERARWTRDDLPAVEPVIRRASRHGAGVRASAVHATHDATRRESGQAREGASGVGCGPRAGGSGETDVLATIASAGRVSMPANNARDDGMKITKEAGMSGESGGVRGVLAVSALLTDQELEALLPTENLPANNANM